jgi:sulfatase modifying factor 1
VSSGAGPGCTGSLEEIQSGSGLCVAKMVAITGPTASTGYQIDATEVTRGQYAAWLATNPALPPSTDANCGWNTTYTPSSTCIASSFVCQNNCDHHPQVCVNWCDASAYCAGVSKRLCGAISGGSNSYASFKAPNLSQWHRACTSGGTYLSPYGNAPDDTKCNEYAYWAPNYDNAATLPVGSLAGCQSPLPGYAGVYDLNGNVWEWEDSCDAVGQTGNCRVRGLGFYYYAELSGCAADNSTFRYQADSGVGLRCCSL